nr:hypothetical protein [Marinicella sp. W31]MDC2879982.1 hypothetical protein [Marinicella sp. W31]
MIAHFQAEERDIEFGRIAVVVETALGSTIKRGGLELKGNCG